MKKIFLFGVPLFALSRKEAAKLFVDFCDQEGQFFTATPNAEILLASQKNEKLKTFLQKSSLNTPDSVSLLWASMVQGEKWSVFRSIFELFLLPVRKRLWTKYLPERVCGSDIFYDICEEAEKQGRSIFLAGGMGGVAQKTLNIVQKKYSTLKIFGGIDGSPREKDDEWMREEINKVKPDILFLAYGCPAQELWIERNLKYCPSVKVAMGIGGTFDFVAGNIKRAPKVFQNLGLEWLWRLFLQPSRFKRILNAVFVFPFRFLKSV